MARQRDQPERREDGGQREQQRNARRHQRPECKHQDRERDRERQSARLAQIVAVRGFDRLDPARVPELSDEEARVSALGSGDAVQDRPDLVDRLGLVAADLELDERRMPVRRDPRGIRRSERRVDVADVRRSRDARDDILDGVV